MVEETIIGGNTRERIVLRLWRKRTGLRKMAGRRYEVLSKSCIFATSGRK